MNPKQDDPKKTVNDQLLADASALDNMAAAMKDATDEFRVGLDEAKKKYDEDSEKVKSGQVATPADGGVSTAEPSVPTIQEIAPTIPETPAAPAETVPTAPTM